MADGVEKVSIAWHPAFCSATEFDLRNEKGNLEFEPEHNLSREPLRMDLLIIKKNTNEPGGSDISRIFRKYNVIEYKSPDDGLTIDDFYKTIGYACLYKGMSNTVNEISANELTVSVFRESYPEELIKTLKEQGEVIEKRANGVYEVKSMLFPAQIVVTKELDAKQFAGLKVLSKKASKADIEEFIGQAIDVVLPGDKQRVDAILQACVSANKETFEKIKKEDPIMCEAMRVLMKDEIDETENRFAKLVQILVSQGRTEDILKVTEDADYRHKLIKELVVL